jgi:protein-tyrosine phosphatase
MIDFHNHLVPGVDDGADDLDQSRAALAAMAAQGVRTVVVTPHFNASTTASPGEMDACFARVDPAWERLRAMAAAEFPGVRLERGVEVKLDTPQSDLSDPRVRLAGTQFVLVEFPFMAVPPNAAHALFDLKVQGWTPIVAHPERYSNLEPDLRSAHEWRRVGAHLQVNCGSVLGRYGPQAKELAWALLRRGMADYLCSDYHARGEPWTAECRAALEAAGGRAQAERLMEENPARMLENELPEPVPPLSRRARPWWSRVLGR